MTETDATRGTLHADRRRGPSRPPRERVTSVDRVTTRTEPVARAMRPEVGETETLFTRTLMRAHGRLALACVLSFVAAVACVTFVISELPQLHDLSIVGLPLPWLIHAYGFYPVIIVWAIGYTLAAIRIERRFNLLVEHE